MHLRRTLALAAAATATVFAACKEPPFAPRWDADYFMPLSFQAITLAPAVIPAAGSVPAGFPDSLQQDLGVLGDLLKNLVTDPGRCSAPAGGALSCDLVTLTMTKTLPLVVQDTLYVATAPGNLNAAAPGTIGFPITLAAGDVTKTDSLYLTQASVAMLQAAGQDGTPLWIHLRGTATNQTGGNVTVTASDSVGITKLSVTIRVAISHQ